MRLRDRISIVLVTMVLLLCMGAASGVAGERMDKALVMVEGAADGAGPISVYDASAGKEVNLAAIGDMLLARQYDAAIVPLGHSNLGRPFSACDDAHDCAQVADTACDVFGADVRTLIFDAIAKTCTATCDSGRLVEVVCSTANGMSRAVIVDDGAPI